MGVRGSNDDEAEDYARIDREALGLLKDAGPVKGVGIIALHMAQEVALASRPRAGSRPSLVSTMRRVTVREEPGVHPIYGAYDAVYVLDEAPRLLPDEMPVELQEGERILTSGEVRAEEAQWRRTRAKLRDLATKAGDTPAARKMHSLIDFVEGLGRRVEDGQRELEEANLKPGQECPDPRGHVWTADSQCKFCDLTREQAGELNRKPGRLVNLDLRGL